MGTVCDDSFGSSDARVACRQLGYSTSTPRYGTVGRLGWVSLHACIIISQCNNHSPLYIVSPKLHHILGHGWTSFVAQELRANSLIVLLALSELKIAAIHKMWPWSVLHVSMMNNFCYSIIIIIMYTVSSFWMPDIVGKFVSFVFSF